MIGQELHMNKGNKMLSYANPILFISPLPPPQGGIAMWTKILVDMGLPNNIPISIVDTKIRGNRNVFDHVFISFSELSRTIRIWGSLIYQLVFKKPKLMHLNCSLSATGIFRDLSCAVLSRLFQIPVVSHYHGNVPDFCGKRFYGLSKIALRILISIVAINIVENKPSLETVKLLPLRKDTTIVLLPNFIEDKIFNYNVKVNNDGNRLRALFAGGITRAKGCAEIIAVAKQLPVIDFHLFGKMHNDMVTLFKNPPANIILHGVVDHDVLLKEMCISDFLLFPSYTEGFPLTVLEAMTVGIPVIATWVGALPEMIDEGLGGFLVAPQDVSNLVSAITKLISSTPCKLAMGQYNKQKSFNHYRYSTVISRLLAIYQQIL